MWLGTGRRGMGTLSPGRGAVLGLGTVENREPLFSTGGLSPPWLRAARADDGGGLCPWLGECSVEVGVRLVLGHR